MNNANEIFLENICVIDLRRDKRWLHSDCSMKLVAVLYLVQSALSTIELSNIFDSILFPLE